MGVVKQQAQQVFRYARNVHAISVRDTTLVVFPVFLPKGSSRALLRLSAHPVGLTALLSKNKTDPRIYDGST